MSPVDEEKAMEFEQTESAASSRISVRASDKVAARKMCLVAAIVTAVALCSIAVGVALGLGISNANDSPPSPPREPFGVVIVNPNTGFISGPGVSHTISIVSGSLNMSQSGIFTVQIESNGETIAVDVTIVQQVTGPERLGNAPMVDIGSFRNASGVNETYLTAILPASNSSNETERVPYTCGADSCVPGWNTAISSNSRRLAWEEVDVERWTCGNVCEEVCTVVREIDVERLLTWSCDDVSEFVCSPLRSDSDGDSSGEDSSGEETSGEKTSGEGGSGSSLTPYDKCRRAVSSVCGRKFQLDEARDKLREALVDELGLAAIDLDSLPSELPYAIKEVIETERFVERCTEECTRQCRRIVVTILQWVNRRSCFPAHAQVSVLRDGAQQNVPISQVGVGDLVMARNGFEPIFFQGHASKDASPYVRLSLESKLTLELSPDHYLRLVNPHGELETHVLAKDAAVGMRLAVSAEAEAEAEVKTATVLQVERTVLAGAYNPYTTSGTIIVNGIEVSCHSSWFLEGVTSAAATPLLYQQLLAPLRALYAVAPRLVKSFCAKFDGDNRPMSELGLRQIVGSIFTSVSA
mmetsp:Transcript_25482/g.55764  ORF Transcript_25482/g.55764 Transcript_25482/m.55764 type:complete len:582 (-) Transcript_25482:241-1986(-)